MKDQVILSWPLFILILSLGAGVGWYGRCEYTARKLELRGIQSP